LHPGGAIQAPPFLLPPSAVCCEIIIIVRDRNSKAELEWETAMISENDLQVGDVLGGFKIERVLGRGGMGVVFKAHELTLNRKIALKVLATRLSTSDEFLQRFKREAQVIASLKHPNIVNILSYGQDKGLHFFAMEYVQGRDLREILKENPLMPFEEALNIIRQVADGLSEAGTKGVVHRDIKPSNIMIDSMGRAYLTDFGVACFEEATEKLTQTGLFLGTPEYSSPEQAKGLPLDVRSDIYSLGAVLYRMLSGRPPVSGESPLAVVVKISTEPVTPIAQINSAVPKPICALLDKMMAREVGERYQSPKAMLADIDRCLNQLRGQTTQPGFVGDPFDDTSSRKAAAEKPRGKLAGVLGSILGIAMAVFLIVWLVEGKVPSNRDETRVQEGASLEPSPEQRAQASDSGAGPAAPLGHAPAQESGPISPPPAAQAATAAVTAPMGQGNEDLRVESAPAAVASRMAPQAVSAPAPVRPAAPVVGVVPKDPFILVFVSGEESMTALTRTYLHNGLRGSGLKILTPAEIPVLREKMRLGDLPISWYDIHRIVPEGRAQVLMLAEIIQTGVTPIRYMGRSDELIRAAFTLQAMDMETGESILSSASDTIQFTALNMDQKLKEGIASATLGAENEIRRYWSEKSGTIR
jgi:serine/threonine protein kinase